MKPNKNHSKERITLENLSKKSIYSVSDGYFDQLPSRIQDRVIKAKKQRSPGYMISMGLRIALPVLALVLMLTYFGTRINNNDLNIEALLEDIPTETLITFINESDLSTEELISMIDLEELDVDGMVEDDIKLLNDDDLDALMEDYPDLETDI